MLSKETIFTIFGHAALLFILLSFITFLAQARAADFSTSTTSGTTPPTLSKPSQAMDPLPDYPVSDKSQPPPLNMLIAATNEAGVRQCSEIINRLATANIGTATHKTQIDAHPLDPNRNPFVTQTAITTPDGPVMLTITVAPMADRSCTFIVDRTSISSASCATVAKNELSDTIANPMVRGITTYNRTDNSNRVRESVSLIDDGPHCIVMRHGIRFNWGLQQR